MNLVDSEQQTVNNLQKKGFTLLELLVVIGIISIIGVIAADIFSNVTRSYNKAEIINRVQRSGNTVLAQMTEEIRNAGRVVSPNPGSSGSSLVIEDLSGNQATFSFVSPDADDNGFVSRNGVLISDNDFSNGVNATSLVFTVLNTSPTVVGITISLEQPLGAPGRIDFQAKTDLTTTVSLRTYE
jgi:prepilin-type N-terminal cleavage/methylation domain-containing protein